jgi:hypothetical protein
MYDRRTVLKAGLIGAGVVGAPAVAASTAQAAPALKYASWVHGNAFTVPENPASTAIAPVPGRPRTDIVGLHQGWGQTWRGRSGTANWFHVGVPTPVIVDDVRLRLQRVMILFAAGVSCDLTNVHVWDGPNRIQTFGPFAITRNHFGGLDASNTFNAPANPLVFWGVGISVLIRFNTAANITFYSAGIDFVT